MATSMVRRGDDGAPVCTFVEGERLALHKGTGQAYFLVADHTGTKKRVWIGRYFAPGRSRVPDPLMLTRAAQWVREYHVLGSPPPKEKAPCRSPASASWRVSTSVVSRG